MPHRADTLRHETRFVLRITTRDLGKRVAAFATVLLVCHEGGVGPAPLAALALAMVLLEAGKRVVAARADRHGPEPRDRHVAALWLLTVSSTLVALAPAILLAGQPSIALMLAGLLWLFGVHVHISNTYAALPLYNWSLMLPAFGMGAAVFHRAAGTDFASSPPTDWWIAAGTLALYSVNVFETMTTQKDTQRALAIARAEATARLRALERVTQHDGLTGLLTRKAFDEGLAEMLMRRGRGQVVAVLLVDLDGFKPINDSYCHEAGDRVLAAVATRLGEAAGPEALVARLGGDEFGLAVTGLPSGKAAMRFADSIARRVELPIEWESKRLRITASVGVSLAQGPEATVAGLCSSADQAMYRAKSDRTPHAVLYDAATFPRRRSLQDRAAIAEALASGAIQPWYQPKVRLDSGALCGFEALARWQHPERGTVMPGEFLPLIQEFGMHSDLLAVISRQVLTDIGAVLADGLDPGQVSINVPEVALATHSGFTDLARILLSAPDAARHLTLEITEDVFIARAGSLIQTAIARFRRAGIRVSLDDFGTGFASFQHLRQLEFDELKIDTSFVRGLGTDRTAEVLVQGFLQIAEGLGVDVIAEGVENDDQRAQLLRMGCRIGQGWRFGKALPFSEARIRIFAEAAPLSRPPVGRPRRRYAR